MATKPATGVTTDVAIVVADDPDRPDYVSRGGHKLAGALAAFEPAGLVVAGRRCLDAGASTGGFTDVLLRARRGAGRGRRRRLRPARVVAPAGRPGRRARPDERPRAHPRGHRRARWTWSSATCRSSRSSWCSTRCSAVTDADGDLVLMVKPQFEVGKERLGQGGVVRDPGAARRGRRRRSRTAAGAPGLGRPGGDRRARCPDRRATSSSSCGCGAAPAAIDADDIDAAVEVPTRWGCRVRGWTRD